MLDIQNAVSPSPDIALRAEQLRKAEQQLAKLGYDLRINMMNYVGTGKIEEAEKRAAKIVCSVYPDCIWPGLNSPMKTVNRELKRGYRMEGNKGGAFKVDVRRFYGRYCEERPNDKLGAFMTFEDELRDFMSGSRMGLQCPISAAGLVILTHGCLFAMVHMAEIVLGEELLLTKGLRAKLAHYDKHRVATNCPSPTSQEFRALFARFQTDLLTWTGIAQDKAIALP